MGEKYAWIDSSKQFKVSFELDVRKDETIITTNKLPVNMCVYCISGSVYGENQVSATALGETFNVNVTHDDEEDMAILNSDGSIYYAPLVGQALHYLNLPSVDTIGEISYAKFNHYPGTAGHAQTGTFIIPKAVPVYFNSNGERDASNQTYSTAYRLCYNRAYYGDTVRSLEMPKYECSNSDHEFISWNTKSDGSGKSYNQGSYYSSSDEKPITFYAIWKSNRFYVRYFESPDNLPKSKSESARTFDSQTKMNGTDISITSKQPSKKYNKFLGWQKVIPK